MSPTEALIAIEGSVRTSPSDLPLKRLGTGEDALLTVPSVIAANHEFVGLIYFLNDGLSRVRLQGRFQDRWELTRAYEDIVRALRSRYGEEVDSEGVPYYAPEPGFGAAIGSTTWIAGGVEIEAHFLLSEATSYYGLDITYTPIRGLDNL